MGFKCGIIGLPNIGKSTLFNALTQTSQAQAENYPFCTIEPNIGEVDVPDDRLNQLSIISSSARTTPTRITFVDIAGLVEGASQGEGLGNKFLANIREVDAVAHIIRCFDDDNITHVNGKIDPIRDIEIINTELLLADLESLQNKIPSLEKKERSGDKEAKEKLFLIDLLINNLNDGKSIKSIQLDKGQRNYLKEFQLLTNKQTLYVCNTDEESINKGNKFSESVEDYIKDKDAKKINISAEIESQLSLLNKHEKLEFLETIGLKEPGLNKLITEGYNVLQLITFFTSGPKESKAWTIKEGSFAPQAAGKIHTDFEKGFIKAETINFKELIDSGDFSKAKDNGKIRSEGKDYQVKDGDIINFRFNV
ncbi:MAG: redox-regulated ATPase YchF [Pseudomonadota bacterium]|nr:redox-regulated ATPase YchF [Pseudomonadota bacterium]MEC7830774.1 redox-regulated ATPase YchF [Pseudomonadota bacterium]MEC9382666.1 redox-regulated ATPase YchF [Pseudomonadota bacterium]